jgi:uncharacterized protein YjbI with pentapeptide repeats
MSDNSTDASRNWLIVLPVIFIFVLFIVFLGFLNVEGLSIEQRLDYGIKALNTTGTIFAGIAVFINAFYAAKRAEAMNKSALAANDSAQAALKNAEAALKNAQTAEDKQITERFAKAIEQLGNEKIEVRLGAIYTLERIAKDSAKDHWTIMEILTAFVRENAPLKEEEEENLPKLRTDIQAALTVIGRRNCEIEEKNQRLDLCNIDIRGADLSEANLQGTDLTLANLQRAKLPKANLQEAFLSKANLQEANLAEANLQGAFLSEANLQSTFLGGANLQEANLAEANFQEANLYKANLQRAFLGRANLQGVELWLAKNLEQHQIESAEGNDKTTLPDNLQHPEHWKSLTKS